MMPPALRGGMVLNAPQQLATGHAAMLHHGGPIHDHEAAHEGNPGIVPEYIIGPPDLLLISLAETYEKPLKQRVTGTYLVKPDGTINLGYYGVVRVAGLTLREAHAVIVNALKTAGEIQFKTKKDEEEFPKYVVVDLEQSLSRYCYVIFDGAGNGETIVRVALDGFDTVLDVVAKTGGLPPVSSKRKIWVARGVNHDHQVLPVDWLGITQHGQPDTNYYVYPRDRVYVHSDPLIRTDTFLAKVLNPIERVMGAVLLGSSTVNSIKGRTGSGR
jgi:protein involved in polysaccharide export with SLBB domain